QSRKITEEQCSMARWIRTVETNCRDKTREAEFNDWYNNVHLPDMLKCPVVVTTRRYERRDPKEDEAKYFAIYEIETDAIEDGLATFNDHVHSLREKGRMSDLVELVSRAIFQQI
ncbi:hypothetical protein ACFLX7_04850, partial [Chloroflexota bacterium]